MPISVLDSDRVCGVRLLLPTQKNHTQRCLTVLGVYMPSSEQSQETYSSYLDTVEHAISQFTADGPLLLVGDLNAHFGSRDLDTQQLCNPATQPCNSRGRQWHSLTETHSLHNVSLQAVPPPHIQQEVILPLLTIYVLGNDDALRRVSSCVTLDDHPLNTSDHLALHQASCNFCLPVSATRLASGKTVRGHSSICWGLR